MKQNIKALLRGRGLKQKDLAEWCRRGESWASKNLALDKPERAIPLRYWDRIADYFGLATYELLQPGISHLTERRMGGRNRRSGNERRIRRVILATGTPATLSVALTPEEVASIQLLRLLAAADRRKVDEMLRELDPRKRRPRGTPNTGSTSSSES